MSRINPKILYSEAYNIGFFGLEKLSHFDGYKYQKIWQALHAKFSNSDCLSLLSESDLRDVDSKINLVHDPEYITRLQNSDYVARILELPDLPFRSILLNHLDFFGFPLQQILLDPMKWAVAGTVKAAHAALDCGIAINLSGGYHHADRNHGEGFCVYSDIAIAIADLRTTSKLDADDSILIVDLDAHQGNGLARIFSTDKSVYMFDMYNKDIYPQDKFALEKQNLYGVPLNHSTDGLTYLSKLKTELPQFLNSMISSPPKIAFYNAGTDVFEGDPLGCLRLTMEQVLERDRYVFEIFNERNIPWVMVLSGGYTLDSHTLVTNSIQLLLKHYPT